MEQINREVQKKKPISLNIQDSVEMAKLKSQFIEKEPIHEGTRRTPEMLKSNVSKKLLAYFFDNYSEVLKTFQSKNRREGFVNEMREILSSEKDLSEQNTFNLEDLYLEFMRKIPLGNKSGDVVFGELGRKAGMEKTEIKEVIKLLKTFSEDARKKMFIKN